MMKMKKPVPAPTKPVFPKPVTVKPIPVKPVFPKPVTVPPKPIPVKGGGS